LYHVAELFYGWIISDLQQRIVQHAFSSTVADSGFPGIVRFFTLLISLKRFIVRLTVNFKIKCSLRNIVEKLSYFIVDL